MAGSTHKKGQGETRGQQRGYRTGQASGKYIVGGHRRNILETHWLRPGSGPTFQQESHHGMTREELQAHLDRNEAEVKRMTEGVTSKLDNISDKLDSSLSEMTAQNNAFKSEVQGDLKAVNKSIEGVEGQISNLRWFIGIILTLAIIVVGLLNYLGT